MQLHGRRIAVTGGAGFIGSHLVDQLAAQGNEVVVFDNFSTGRPENLAQHRSNPKIRIIQGDVCDLPALEKALSGADIAFHLATNCVRLSLVDPMTNHEVNATGTLNTLLAAGKNKVQRFVYCSSSEVYGNIVDRQGSGHILSEDSAKLPTTVYGASKLVGEHYALAFHQTHGLPAMIVRPFNTYGPRSHIAGPYGEVIPRFTVMIRAGRQPVIFGDGRQTRDFTYVEDTAACLIAAAGKDELLGDSVNLAHGEEVSILELTRILCELHKVPFNPKHVDDRPGDIRRLGADTRKARKLLGSVAMTPIREGLARYLRWFDGQKIDAPRIASSLTEKNWLDPANAAGSPKI